jgi:hypothetical protein
MNAAISSKVDSGFEHIDLDPWYLISTQGRVLRGEWHDCTSINASGNSDQILTPVLDAMECLQHFSKLKIQ